MTCRLRIAPGTQLAGVRPIVPRANRVGSLRLSDAIWIGIHLLLFMHCVTTAGGPRARAQELLDEKRAEYNAMLLNASSIEELERQVELFDMGASDLSSRPLTLEELESTPLPHEYLPDFLPLFLLASSGLLHMLFLLSLRWLPSWKALVDHTAARDLSAHCQLLISPLPNCGVERIVSVAAVSPEWLKPEDGGEYEQDVRYFFTYNHARFEIALDGAGGWLVRGLSFPTARSLDRYVHSIGLRDAEAEAERLQQRFGKNSLDIPPPTFTATFIEQILGPVPCFQMFCCSLWFLDAYWYYALFSLFMVAMLEASTAFQRVKSVQSLRAMQNNAGSGTSLDVVHAYRGGQWVALASKLELVPGDVFSIPSPISLAAASASTADSDADADDADEEADGGAEPSLPIPCDAVIIAGGAVVNEASLTGESAPQMKEAVQGGEGVLDMTGLHRVSVLHSGTTLLQLQSPSEVEGSSAASASSAIPPPPDGGMVCVCLRTGFGSSQGKLVRMLENSGASVRGDSKETLALFAILLTMASLASAQVLRAGLADPKRSPYEVMLRCVLILTSVVPPELPMQAAAAVHAALLALHRQKVFCTEPHRVPLAGHVTSVLFDKTGTITTDHLSLAGVSPPLPPGATSSDQERATLGLLVPVRDAAEEVRLILATCHSLVAQGSGGKLAGDPIEMAAASASGWKYDPRTQRSSLAPTEPAKESKGGKAGKGGDGTVERKVQPHDPTEARIVHRYHFASALQRMSVVAEVAREGSRKKLVTAMVKGSPEAVLEMLEERDWPGFRSRYMRQYRSYAERGMRVLALAMKEVSSRAGSWNDVPRSEVECDLRFVAFAAFFCQPRKDSASVITHLRDGATRVIMVTGDAPETALFVAQTCCITNDRYGGQRTDWPVLQLAPDGSEWRELVPAASELDGDCAPRVFEFADPSECATLADQFTLIATGPAFRAALDRFCRGKLSSGSCTPSDGGAEGEEPGRQAVAAMEAGVWAAAAEYVAVYARMTPADKELLVLALGAAGHRTFMCGDGANDVGALRRADVGLALLSGFGTANTAVDGEKSAEELTEQERREKQRETLRRRKERAARLAERKKKERAELQEVQKRYYEEELAKAEAAGESFAPARAMGRAVQRTMAFQKERLAKQKRRGEIGFAAEAAWMAEEMGGLEGGGMPVVQLGDASVAAPFTSKLPSTQGVVDIVRQGRCTLASMVQNQQILVLTCLISAYSLSALYIDNVRMAEAQMMSTGMLLSVASIAFSFARPIERLAPVRPLGTIFHPANVLSTVGQLAIALACMWWAVGMAKAHTDAFGVVAEAYVRPDWLQEVIDQMAAITGDLEQEQEATMLTRPFRPSLLNTVVFLVETAQQVSVIMVNYRGRPFMLASTENWPMMLSLLAVAALILTAASEAVPELNGALRLVPLPDDAFRYQLLAILAASLLGTVLVDRVAALLFAPHLAIRGYIEAYKALPTVTGFLVGTVKVLAAATVVLFVLGSGQWFLGMIIAFFYYRYRQSQANALA